MIVEFDEECQSCNGTGLYVGCGEHNGAAVVCSRCNGTGCYHFKHEYVPFTERHVREGAVRVFQANPGICIGEDLMHSLTDFGGMSFLSWWNGQPFPPGSEDRAHTCPCWFYQSADSSRKPKWDECDWGRFSECKQFPTKWRCWERFDKEGL